MEDVSEVAPGVAGVTEGFSHVDGAGRARMVDVTGKPWTLRKALARCRVKACDEAIASLTPPGGSADGISPSASAGVREDEGAQAAGNPSGPLADMLLAARLAGIQAAKRTPSLIPLCHPLTVSRVDVRLAVGDGGIEVEGEAEVVGPTGVEMEALTACAFAALSILFELRRVDPHSSIEDLGLWEKSGGRSGTWSRT